MIREMELRLDGIGGAVQALLVAQRWVNGWRAAPHGTYLAESMQVTNFIPTTQIARLRYGKQIQCSAPDRTTL